MKLVRILLGLMVSAYGVGLLVAVLNISAFKLGLMHQVKPHALRLVPLWEATPVWALVVWALGVTLMLGAGVQLFRGRPAFRLFVAAFVTIAGLWWAYRGLPQFQQVFSEMEQRSDYYILSVMLLIGAGVWLVDHPLPRRSSPA